MSDALVSRSPSPLPSQGMPERGLRRLRPWGERRIRRTWDVRDTGMHHVPATGPVILACNHVGWLDGPLMIGCAPRPAHALVKHEAFVGRTGALLRFVGQIPVRREARDVGALRRASSALLAGQCVVVYPEGIRGDGEVRRIKDGVAWLALVSGAPVVPVALFGTRAPGAGAETKPARGARVDIVYGEPFRVDAAPWPRPRAHVADVAAQIHAHLRGHVAWAAETRGLSLPGPLPEEDDDE